jgi:hypothetical protein
MREWILIAGALLAACSGGTEPGQDGTLLVVTVSDTLQADSTLQLQAYLRNGSDSVAVPDVVWSSRSPDIASVDDDGTVTGHASGVVTLVALAGDLRGTRDLRIERRFRAQDVSTGSAGVCAVDLGGEIWCENGWGNGVPFPEADTVDIRTFLAPISGSERYTLVGSNQHFGCGLTTAKRILCWGSSIFSDSLSAAVPTPIAPSVLFDTLSVDGWMGCGLSAGAAMCWGGASKRVRTIVTGGHALTRVAVQEYSACGWADGPQIYCWDSFGSINGQLPLEPVPPASPALHGIANGGTFFCGLDATGHAWCWGANESGQLGNGSLDASTEAVQVTGGHQFQLLAADIGESSRRVCGIAERDELFCWGDGFGAVPAAVLF